MRTPLMERVSNGTVATKKFWPLTLIVAELTEVLAEVEETCQKTPGEPAIEFEIEPYMMKPGSCSAVRESKADIRIRVITSKENGFGFINNLNFFA